MDAAYTAHLEAPRWAGTRQFLVETSARTGVELDISKHEKGLIRETIYFTVRGASEKVAHFERLLSSAAQEYQRWWG